MPDSTQTAIRVGDDILHSDALFGGIEGILLGAAAGLLIGALIVSTGGLAGVVLVAGWGLLGAGLGGTFGKILGSHHSAGAKGKVLTGSPNVFIGYDKKPAARAEADVAHCEEHSDSEPAHDVPAVLGHRIAQGSEHVLINGHYAARKGDKGTCDFTLGDGWPTVVIGGPPKTVAGLTITSETASIDGLILGMMIAGGVLLAAPAVVGIFAEGLAGGLGWQAVTGIAEQIGGRLVVPLVRGIVLSKVMGQGLRDIGGRIAGQGSLTQDVMGFFGEVGGGFAGGMGEAGAGEAGAGEAGAGEAGAGEGEAGTRRYGGTGSDAEITSNEASQARANAAYEQIRANDDVARVAENTGHSPETIQTVKDHLFNSQHDIFNPETGESAPGNFTPDEGTASLWNKAADGTLGQPRLGKWDVPIEGSADPGEVADFNRLIAHEYVEQGLVSDGLPYQARSSWVQDASGEWQYKPGPDSIGAHDLSPNAHLRPDPFSHYDGLGRSSEGIPRPDAANSNLDDVLAGIRRGLPGGGAPEGGLPGGGGPGGGRAPEEPFTPARPLPPNPPEGRPITPAPEAEPPAAPGAAPGGEPGTGTAPEPTAPLAENAPEAARATPEPAPDAAAPDTTASPDFTGRLRGEGVTLPGVKTQRLTYVKRAEADLDALRSKFDSSARYDQATKGIDPRPVAENRSNFLRGLANEAVKVNQLKAAGISDKGIELMKQGKLPSKAWQVHHKLPLDDGGTNTPDNLVLIKNDPYHLVITNEQNALIGNLKAGETLSIPHWPVPDGFVYPTTAPAVPPVPVPPTP